MKKGPMKMKKASSMKLIKKTKTLKGFNKRGKAQYKTTSRTLTNPITGNKRTVTKRAAGPGKTTKQVVTTRKGVKKEVTTPNKKALVGKQKNLPAGLRQAILNSPAKMLKPAAMKMMKPTAMKMKKASAMTMKKKSAMKMRMRKK